MFKLIPSRSKIIIDTRNIDYYVNLVNNTNKVLLKQIKKNYQRHSYRL